MTDDLTNPDVLAALEIAPVEWYGVMEMGTCRLLSPMVEWNHLDHGPTQIRRATPADLDHALKEWLLWLDKRTPHTVLLTLFDGEARCTLDDAAERFVDEDGESPLLAVAAAVVKVGKPQARGGEETDDDLRPT